MNFLPSHDNRLTQASLLLPLRPMTSWRWPTGRLTLWLMRWGENWASARLSWVESRGRAPQPQTPLPQYFDALAVNQHAVLALKWDVSGWLCLPPAFVPLCIKPATLEFNWKKKNVSASSTPLARGKKIDITLLCFFSPFQIAHPISGIFLCVCGIHSTFFYILNLLQ